MRKRFLSCYKHKWYTWRFLLSFIHRCLLLPIFVVRFVVTFERFAKTFQFLKKIHSGYSRSYFHLFILSVLPRHAIACSQTLYFLFKVRWTWVIKKEKKMRGIYWPPMQWGRGGGKERKRTKKTRKLGFEDLHDLGETVILTLRRTHKVISPLWYKPGGGVLIEPSWVFDTLQLIFWNNLQDVMGGGRWRHYLVTILDFIKN